MLSWVVWAGVAFVIPAYMEAGRTHNPGMWAVAYVLTGLIVAWLAYKAWKYFMPR